MAPTLQQLIHKDTLLNVSIETLEELATKYPYFGTFQFLLAYRLHHSNRPAFEAQYGKTLLYFENPLWLKQQLINWQPIDQVSTSASENVSVPISTFEPDTLDDNITHAEHLPTPSNVETAPELPAEPLKSVHQADVQKDELPFFQAYHTVDYFASQGIRISTELLQGDRLGKQLRSFTEWLRTMKKLPPSTLEKDTPKETDPRIRHFAESSLKEREILTEAMAEVLIKQGKTQQALDTYRKLSLLNPQKSAYFAARIEELKAG